MNSVQHTRHAKISAARVARAKASVLRAKASVLRAKASATKTSLAAAVILTAGLATAAVTTTQKTSSQTVSPVNTTVQDTNLSIALPLVSVGKGVGWKIPPEDYRLYVPQAAANRLTRIDVYSPEVNRNDYANKRNTAATYYGDELYGKNAQVKTTFKLSNNTQAELVNATFASSTTHSTATLLEQQLGAGYYDLGVSSLGNGKNSFQLRTSSGVRVEASTFVVNARGQFNRDQLVAFLDLGQSAIGKTVRLENYDADGFKEMGLTLVDPNGKRRALKISGDTAWASDDVRVTAQNVGTWKILARVLPTTKQFSNSVVFRFKLDGQPLFSRIPGFGTPLPAQPAPVPPTPQPEPQPEPVPPPAPIIEPPIVVVPPPAPEPIPEPPAPIVTPPPVPPQPAPIIIEPPAPANGTLRLNALALVCGTSTQINSSVTINNQPYPTNAIIALAPGQYTVKPETIAGATAQAFSVTIESNQALKLDIEYAVDVALKLEPAGLNLKLGERANLTATVSTAFAYAVPINVSLALPEGLNTDAPLTLSGQIVNAKTLSLTVPVRATKAVQDGVIRAESCGLTQTAAVNATANALPNERRESQLIVLNQLVDVPATGYVILSDHLPTDAQYILGSSRVVGSAKFETKPATNTKGSLIEDPFVAGDRLYWVLPLSSTNTYAVTYRVSHTNSIEIPQNPSVILVSPATRSAGKPRASIDPNSAIGKLTGLGEIRLIQGEEAALENLSKAVLIGSTATLAQRISGGAAQTLQIRGEQLTTDPTNQAALIVEAFDANGNPANDAFATLELNVEPITPDAMPEIAGYQVKLDNGTGRVQLQNLGGKLGDNNPISSVTAQARVTNTNGTISSSTEFKINELSITDGLQASTLPVNTSVRPWVGIGAASLQLNYTPTESNPFSVSGSLEAFARGQAFNDWLLTVALNQRAQYDSAFNLSGSLLPPANPFERFPILGDAGQVGSDARSSEGFYVRLEQGSSYLLYGQMNPNFKGLLGNYAQNFNGFQGLLRSDASAINTFVALVPDANQLARFQGDGTGRYRLPNAVEPSSERIVIVTFDKNNTSLKLNETVLTRGADYAIDYISGNVQLAKVLFENDANGNPQFINVQYAAESSAAPRELRFGAQAALNAGNFTFHSTGLVYNIAGGTNGENLGLIGVGTSYKNGGFQFGLEASYSGSFGSGGGLGLATQVNYNTDNFQTQLRYQELFIGYTDPNTNLTTSGRALTGSASYKFSQSFSLNSNLAHNQDFVTGSANDSASLEARNNFGFATLALGGYGKWNLNSSTGDTTDLYATAGIEIPLGAFRFGALQRVPLTASTYGDTTLSLDYAITPNFGVRLSDKLTYEPAQIRQELAFGVRGSFTNSELIRGVAGNDSSIPDAFGTTNVAASFELNGLSGNAGRTRINIDTSLPISPNLSARIGGEANISTSNTGSANVGLVYNDTTLKAGVQAQASFQATGIKQVYTTSIVGQITPELTISPSLEYAIDPTFTTLPSGAIVQDGGRFSVAAAYRANTWSALTNHTGRFGLYAPKGEELRGELQFAYNGAQRLELRTGLSYLNTANTLTLQLGAGATYFITDTIGVGVQGAYLFQPSTGIAKIAFGIEGSARVMDGLLASVGMNLLGFNNGLSFSTNPGFYVRFDWKFDERTLGLGK